MPGRPYLPCPGRMGLLPARALVSARDSWEHCTGKIADVKEYGAREHEVGKLQSIKTTIEVRKETSLRT